jgi:hypothetical protein
MDWIILSENRRSQDPERSDSRPTHRSVPIFRRRLLDEGRASSRSLARLGRARERLLLGRDARVRHAHVRGGRPVGAWGVCTVIADGPPAPFGVGRLKRRSTAF